MARGIITRLIESRGFGFIRPAGGGQDIFFHASRVQGVSFDQLSEGSQVEYETGETPRGIQATSIRLAEEAPQPPSRPQREKYRFLNPYNFIRFLQPPGERNRAEPSFTSPLGAALQAAGLANEDAVETPGQNRLLDRCTPPPHDRYVGLTGRINCELETVTPLFVSDSEGIRLHGEHRSYDFFKLAGDPALPPTSLRGMVRNVFEAATSACMGSMADRRLSRHLRPQEALKLVPARVEKDENGALQLRLLLGTTPLPWTKTPSDPQYAAWVCQYKPPLRNSRNYPSPGTDYGKRAVVSLNGRSHGAPCWALVKRMSHPQRNFSFWNVERLEDDPGKLPVPAAGEKKVVEGYLCITYQNIENKHDERFFFQDGRLAGATTVSLEKKVREDYEALIKDYQSRHQDEVAKWRDRGKDPAQPDKAKPGKGPDKAAFSRFILEEDASRLKEGDLVYAMLNEGEPSGMDVDFIVPVSIPRVIYDKSIADLLPSHLKGCDTYEALCPACRVFGWVDPKEKEKKKDKRQRIAYAGRVRFSHGTLLHSAGTLPPTPLAILSSPKPTTIRFYLMPGEADGKDSIPEKWGNRSADEGYNGEDNRLRGRKFYRHHGTVEEADYTRTEGLCDDQNRTVRDALSPGARFEFTVDFENLAPVELGALLWALEMDQKGVHRLGFAKPLGFGSVQVRVKEMQVLDFQQRYQSLEDEGWRVIENWNRCVKLFKTQLAQHYGEDDFEALPNIRDLRVLSTDPPRGMPIHYPRVGHIPDPEGKNFEWFMGNNRSLNYTLRLPTENEGLPLITRDGTEIR